MDVFSREDQPIRAIIDNEGSRTEVGKFGCTKISRESTEGGTGYSRWFGVWYGDTMGRVANAAYITDVMFGVSAEECNDP